MKWFRGLQRARDEELENEKIIEKACVYYIRCDKIRSNTMRSRSDFNEDELVSLAYSIKKYGIIEPLCVRATDYDDSYDFEIVTGERRLRAARLLGLTAVPCVIVDVPAEISAEMSLNENLFRAPLSCFEEAFAIKRLCDAYGGSDESLESLASRLSMSSEELVKRLELLELDFAERRIILELNLSSETAVEISRLSDKELRTAVLNTVERKNMSDFEAKRYIFSTELHKNDKSAESIPRDISSAISGIEKRVDFINRHKKRAELSVARGANEIDVRIRIKL